MAWEVMYWWTVFVSPALTLDSVKSMTPLHWRSDSYITTFSLCFCSDLEYCKSQSLIVKSLKPFDELAWLWLEERKSSFWHENVLMYSHGTCLHSDSIPCDMTHEPENPWALFGDCGKSVCLMEGQVFTTCEKGSCGSIQSLVICCSFHGFIVVVSDCILWNTDYIWKYLVPASQNCIICNYEKLTSLPNDYLLRLKRWSLARLIENLELEHKV